MASCYGSGVGVEENSDLMQLRFSSSMAANMGNNRGSGLLGVGPQAPTSPSPMQFAHQPFEALSSPSTPSSPCQVSSVHVRDSPRSPLYGGTHSGWLTQADMAPWNDCRRIRSSSSSSSSYRESPLHRGGVFYNGSISSGSISNMLPSFSNTPSPISAANNSNRWASVPVTLTVPANGMYSPSSPCLQAGPPQLTNTPCQRGRQTISAPYQEGSQAHPLPLPLPLNNGFCQGGSERTHKSFQVESRRTNHAAAAFGSDSNVDAGSGAGAGAASGSGAFLQGGGSPINNARREKGLQQGRRKFSQAGGSPPCSSSVFEADKDLGFNNSRGGFSQGSKASKTCSDSNKYSNISSSLSFNRNYYVRFIKKSMVENPWTELDRRTPSPKLTSTPTSTPPSTPTSTSTRMQTPTMTPSPISTSVRIPLSARSSSTSTTTTSETFVTIPGFGFESRLPFERHSYVGVKIMNYLPPSPVKMRDTQGGVFSSPTVKETSTVKSGMTVHEMMTSVTTPLCASRFSSPVPEVTVADGGG